MSIIESAGGMLWAPRRQPEDVMYLAALAQERFPPEELLDQAQQIATLEAAEPRPGVPRHADGVWTLADPQSAPGVIAAYRRACARAGREAGEIILEVPISWSEHDEQALESAREWKATLVDEHVTAGVRGARAAAAARIAGNRHGSGRCRQVPSGCGPPYRE